MTDIARQRKAQPYGMSGAEGVTDAVTRQVISELQERINQLSAQVNAPAAPVAPADTSLYDYSHREVARLDTLLKGLASAQGGTASKAATLQRTLGQLHAYTISNTTGETIPAYSVCRIASYDPDTDLYTVAKPQGPALDVAELLLFTSHFAIVNNSLGLAYRASDKAVKVNYTAPDAAFTPIAGRGYVTQAASGITGWKLLGAYSADGAMAIGMGAASSEYTTAGGATYIRDIGSSAGTVPFLNSSGYAVPIGGLVATLGGEADGVTLTGTRPAYPGISRCIISTGAVANGATGRGYTGYAPCTINLTSFAGTSVGDMVGTALNVFTATKYNGGNFLVLAKLTTPYARVIRIANRLDNKMIKTGAGATNGRPIKVLLLSANHTVTQTAPNQVTLSYA